MKKLIFSAAAGLALAAMAGTAFAAPVTIVFQNPGADTPTGNFTTDGTCNGISISSADLCTVVDADGFDYSKAWVSLNATAYNTDGVTSLVQDLAPTNSGLAVLSPGETSSDDQVQLANNESILFNFGGPDPVFLLGMDFNAGADVNCATPGDEGPCGTFDLFVDGNLFASYNAMDDMAFGGIKGSLFEVVATGPLDGGFTIGSITVADVPEPASLALFGMGLIGFGLSRRRARA